MRLLICGCACVRCATRSSISGCYYSTRKEHLYFFAFLHCLLYSFAASRCHGSFTKSISGGGSLEEDEGGRWEEIVSFWSTIITENIRTEHDDDDDDDDCDDSAFSNQHSQKLS